MSEVSAALRVPHECQQLPKLPGPCAEVICPQDNEAATSPPLVLSDRVLLPFATRRGLAAYAHVCLSQGSARCQVHHRLPVAILQRRGKLVLDSGPLQFSS